MLNRLTAVTSTTAVLSAVLMAAIVNTASAQALDADETVKTIVGSDVEKVETSAVGHRARIKEAIGNSRDAATKARKLVSVENISLVSVAASESDEASIEAAIDERKDDIAELRQAIEGSAILFNAIDSEGILLRNVVAMEISDRGEVTIFATGAPASN